MHTFQQDNSRAHTACVTTQYLVNNNGCLLEWLELSHDLSPIEHLWDYFGQHISDHPHMNNGIELENVLQQEWNAIPQNTMCKPIRSMRRHCMACVAAYGGHMHY